MILNPVYVSLFAFAAPCTIPVLELQFEAAVFQHHDTVLQRQTQWLCDAQGLPISMNELQSAVPVYALYKCLKSLLCGGHDCQLLSLLFCGVTANPNAKLLPSG